MRQVREAKTAEVKKWQEEKVYEEVQDEGQNRVSTTWVMTEKIKDGQTVIKARLVARGYEEDKEAIRSDSPTCMKDSIRMLLAIAAGKGWQIHALDVKAAFLQGNSIERELFLYPPAEFRKKGTLWRLKKVVYGLCDASRSWYLKVVEILTSLGMIVTRADKAVFTYLDNNLQGMVIVHVDDMLYIGSDSFLERVMNMFKSRLKISREDSVAFKYLGVSIKQNADGIVLDQTNYVKGLKVDLLDKERLKEKESFASSEEITLFRQAVGQLGWLTSVSKPDSAFAYCHLSVIQAKPQIKDFIAYQKVVKSLLSQDWSIKIGCMNIEELRVCAFCDASFANLSDGASQIGYVIFVHDEEGKCAPITWTSKKARRIARSTLAAETLSAVETADSAVFLNKALEEILITELPTVTVFVDNKSLYDAVRITSLLAEKRLLIEMADLREMQEKRAINVQWVSSPNQLADVLTKAGANRQKLIDVLCTGKLDFEAIRSG